MAGDGSREVMHMEDLSLQQLQQLNQQLEQEIEFMTGSLSQLKEIQQKFVQSQESLAKINRENSGKDILVPLTSSMYTTGQLDDVDNVLIDIGTGYYIEKNVAAAKEYFKKKIDYLSKQMEKIQPSLQEKYKIKQGFMEAIQTKVQTQVQAQQAASAKSS